MWTVRVGSGGEAFEALEGPLLFTGLHSWTLWLCFILFCRKTDGFMAPYCV